MKKVVLICCAIAAMCACFTSCDETGNGYEGTNYIYLSSTANSMFDTEDASLTIDVALTTALKEDLVLTFKSDDTEGIITLEGNPVTIKAGEKNGTFTIRTAAISEASKNFKVTLAEETALPEKVVLNEDFTFTVNSSKMEELTAEQKAIVDAYFEATGIYLPNYLGLVNVTAEYTTANFDYVEEPVTLKGQTTIVLSETSTVEKPVLKMAVNPMGIHDVTYAKFRSLTIENDLYWFDPDQLPCYTQLVEAIGWTKTSDEKFTMTLDGITLNADKTVSFLLDESFEEEFDGEIYKTTMIRVPFEYTFSAYERELEKLAAGVIGPDFSDMWLDDATADPNYHLNTGSVDFETYDYDFGGDNWIESVAEISNDKLEFSFCVYNTGDCDYTKVTATYTPNK